VKQGSETWRRGGLASARTVEPQGEKEGNNNNNNTKGS
jgi:hypothetical protein